jgi:hypothetical protein
MNPDTVYKNLADTINQTVGRKAVSVKKIKTLVADGKRIRKQYGLTGLWLYASLQLPYHFFTKKEIEKLKKSPRWNELSYKTIDAMVVEGVINPMEARMIKRSVHRN